MSLPSQAPQIAATPPDFTLNDLAGGEARLRDLVLLGPLVLIFCKSCEGCIEHLRAFKKRNVGLHEAGAWIVLIVQGKAAATKAFVEKERLPFRVLADELGEVLSAWGLGDAAEHSAATFVVDKGTVVRFRAIGGEEGRPAHEVLEWLRGHGAGGQAQG
ncbi:MAG: peroxiredoxin family protein [Polyangiales bacterium]